MKHILFRTAAFLFSILILLTCLPSSVSAADTGRQTVNVGILVYPGYAEEDENGVWTGYDAEMMENIAQHCNIEVHFVQIRSMQDADQGLADGTLDIAGNVALNDERQQTYLFSDYSQGVSFTSIVMRKDDTRIDYGDIEALSKLSFGVLAGFPESEFDTWCSSHGISPKKTIYSDSESAFSAVDSQDVDAIVLGDDYIPGYRKVLSFSQVPYYYIFRKQDTALKSQVDAAMSQILLENPLYQNTLREKYGISSVENVAYTSAENEYIAAHPDISVAVIEKDKPYFSYDAAGNPKGIIPDLYKVIAENTGFHFTFKSYPAHKDAASAVLNGEADVLAMYSNGIPYAYSDGFRLSAPYATIDLVMISRSGEKSSEIRRIAIKNRSIGMVKKSIESSFKNVEYIACDTASDCFDALQENKADALIVALPSATYLINQTNSSAYSFIPLAGAGVDICAAVAFDNVTLGNIMSKGVSASTRLFNGIEANNTVSESSLQTFFARIPAVVLAISAIASILIIMVLVWSVISLLRSRKTKIAAVRARAEAEASERSAEEKNSFFSNISHDMRTPLNAVIGFAGLAENAPDIKKKNEYLSKIKSSGQLLNSLIDDTLTLSKGNSGKLELHPTKIETEDIGRTITETIRSSAAAKNITFTVDKSEYRPRTIYADELNLQKIFLNLLTNAIKYTPEGGHVWVKIWDEPAGSPEPDTVFTIRDDGIGISPDFLPHVFEPFMQEKRHGYESVGTGLGLSIVKQIVDLMGGTIKVKSVQNQGTEFTVRLHFLEIKNPSSAAADHVRSEETDLTGRKILLCEDNELNREIAVAILEDRGMTVEAAVNGQIGLEKFSKSSPGYFDAILMDIRMPVMDGYETVKAIRQLDRPDAVTVPIIAMTADAFSDAIQKCLDSGMNSHIAKPVDPEKIYAVLSELILSKK
jgi:signal transduction histidine kinase/ABC-type amino acid transport substrate-binding protein/ActR/RegA family two-component response regulator